MRRRASPSPRVVTAPVALELFVRTPGPNDEVAPGVHGNSLAIDYHRGPLRRVVIAHAKAVRAIAWAKVKDERIDALVPVTCLPRVPAPRVDAR